MSQVTRKQFTSSVAWSIFQSFANKGITFVVSLVLARLLMPEDYGLLAMTSVFITFSDMLIDGGFTTALVQKKEVDDYDYSSVFILSVGIAGFLYLIVFLIAPWVAQYYVEPQLSPVLRVMCLSFFAPALSATRNASLTRALNYKYMFKVNVVANIIGGIAGIVGALLGWGVWALVAQRLTSTFLNTVVLQIRIRWNFKLKFELHRIKELLSFSMGVLGSSFLNYMASSISSAIIGKRYSMEELAYSDKGGQFPMQISLYTFGAMSGVLLPTLSKSQNDIDRMKHIIRRVTRMTAYLIAPLMVGLAVTGEEVITLLLTEKWLPSTRILQYQCLYYLATPFMLINVQLFFAMGKTYLRVKTETIRLALSLLSLLIFAILAKSSIYVLALSGAIIAIISSLLTAYESKKLIGYTFFELLQDIYEPILVSVIMGLAVIGADILLLKNVPSVLIKAICKIIIGAGVYLGYSLFFKPKEFDDVLKLLHIRKAENER